MNQKKFLVYLIVLISFLLEVFNNAYAQKIKVAIGLSLPPYVIKENNTGMELDIVRKSLKVMGYEIKTRYVVLKNVPLIYRTNKVDCAMTVNENLDVNGFFSDEVIIYQNYAITLAESPLIIKSISDLKNKKIIAFQNANKYLGDEFANVVEKNDDYFEAKNQLNQVKLLQKKRYDIAISDINIFKYFKKQIPKLVFDVKFHAIFPPNPYKVVFHEKKIRDKFNEGLKYLRKTGEYEYIINSYIKD